MLPGSCVGAPSSATRQHQLIAKATAMVFALCIDREYISHHAQAAWHGQVLLLLKMFVTNLSARPWEAEVASPCCFGVCWSEGQSVGMCMGRDQLGSA
jgi:hypothetical protein